MKWHSKNKEKIIQNDLPSSQKQIKDPSYSGWYSKDTNSSRYNSFYFCPCKALSFRKAESALIATVKSNMLNGRGVTRPLSHETKRDTRLSSRERDEICFRLFFFRGTKSLSQTFSLTVPIWWNDLPNSIPAAESLPIFKKRLKTHLFHLYLTL